MNESASMSSALPSSSTSSTTTPPSASSSSSSSPLTTTTTTSTATTTTDTTNPQQTQPEGGLFIEANRLATFHNWPNPNISPQSLAKAGFYYLNRSDEVKCVWCKGVIAKWEKEDNAFEEHKRFFPGCPRVQLGPLIEMTSDGIRELGIQQISPPKRPKYATLDTRLRSYTNWPIPDIQSPLALAQAGLYYQDTDDQVRCFQCNIGLRSWQKEDDPWHEHAKWYPPCQFVNLVKGVRYVQQVLEATRNESDQFGCYEAAAVATPPLSIEEAMSTAPVLHALEMGIDVGSIRTVTYQHILATGRPYSTVEDLVKAVFGDRDGEDDDEYAREQNQRNEERSEASQQARDVPPSHYYYTDNLPPPPLPPRIESVRGEPLPLPTSTILRNGHSGGDRAIEQRALKGSSKAQPTTNEAEWSSASSSSSSGVSSRSSSSSSSTAAEPPTSLTLEEENRKLKDARLCKVCLDDEVGIVFLPCGHLVTCFQCAPSVNQCPMCRSSIKGFVRTYLS